MHTEIFIDMQIYMLECKLYFFILLNLLRGPRRNNIPEATSIPNPRSWFLIPFPNKQNQGNFGEVVNSRTERGKTQDEPEASCSSRK